MICAARNASRAAFLALCQRLRKKSFGCKASLRLSRPLNKRIYFFYFFLRFNKRRLLNLAEWGRVHRGGKMEFPSGKCELRNCRRILWMVGIHPIALDLHIRTRRACRILFCSHFQRLRCTLCGTANYVIGSLLVVYITLSWAHFGNMDLGPLKYGWGIRSVR